MENRHQKCEKNSEISYLKLENTRDVQTPQQGNFILKPEFLKHILQRNAHASKPIHHQYYKDSFNYQSDEEFLNEVFQIVEKHMNSLSHQQNKKQLEEHICDQIHEKCIRHRQANKFNMNSNYHVKADPNNKKLKEKTDQKIDLKCFCGCGKYQGDPLPLCNDQLKYYFFGPLILVFFYLRKMVTLLTIIALIYGVYSVVTNLILAPEDVQNECLIDPGMLSFLCPIKQHASTLNKLKTGYQKLQVWLGFLACIGWLLSVRIIKSLGRSLNKKIDSFLDSSSDYVVQVENLPHNCFTQTQLLKYIASLWRNLKGNTKLPEIKSVQIIYQMDEARKMIKEIIANACKLSANLRKRVAGQNICHEIKQGQLESYLKSKMQLIKSIIKIQEYRSKFINDSQFRKKLTTEIAFIQFNDSKDQAELLRMTKQYRITILGSIKQYITSKFFNSQNDSYIFKGNNIRITRAPEPSDISWINCEKKNSYKRIALVWFISLLMVCISFGFLNFIRFLRLNFENLEFMSILFSISLQAFNRIIWNTLVQAVNLEQNNTNTDNVISIMSKGAFAQAINVLIIPLIFNYVMRNNLYGPQGLISSTLDYHFTFFFIQIFLNLINVPYQIRRISLFFPCIRNWVIRRYSNVVGVVDTGEEIKQVLSYYETPTFSIASVYTSTNTIIFHTMFYLHIQPLLIFTLIFNILTVYFMQKYLFLRRYKIPELVDYIIFQNCFSYLQHVPLIYAAGSLTFIYLTEQSVQAVGSFNMSYIPSILCIVVWLIGMTNPFSILNKFTKYFVNKLGAYQNQIGQKQDGLSSQKMQKDMVNQNMQDNNVYVRRQSYYKLCGTNDLLQYQAKLTQILRDDEYQSINKIFCQRFSLKPCQLNQNSQSIKNSTKKNSMKLLKRMKQSFGMVKQDKPVIDLSKNNNRILPIDKFPLNINNQNNLLKSSIKVVQTKQPKSIQTKQPKSIQTKQPKSIQTKQAKSSARNNNKQNVRIIKQLKQNKQQNYKQIRKQKQQPIKQLKLYNQIQLKKQNKRIKQKQKIFNKPLTQRGQKQNSNQQLQTKNRLVISSRPDRSSYD